MAGECRERGTSKAEAETVPGAGGKPVPAPGSLLRTSLSALFRVLLLAAALPGAAAGAPKDLLGKAAPAFVGPRLGGGTVDFAAMKGKTPVILTFWSIYCKSCTEEMDALQRLYEKYGAEKVSVVAVNEDGDVGLGRVRNFLERSAAAGRKFTFPILFDEKSEVFRRFGVDRLPTLVYIETDGTVREVIEGYERGRELAVTQAIEKLIGRVAPEPLKEVEAEAIFDLEVTAPICGVYRDGKWFRPLDLDEYGRPEAIARARAQGEEYLRREAFRLALLAFGVSLRTEDRIPSCLVPYGTEIRTPVRRQDTLDLLLEKVNMPRVTEVLDQETVERDRELFLYRRIRIALPVLRETMEREGYTASTTTLRIRFVETSVLEERTFVEAVVNQFPYLSELRKEPRPKAGDEYLLVSHAEADRVAEALRGLDVGPRKLSVDLLPGELLEVAMWR